MESPRAYKPAHQPNPSLLEACLPGGIVVLPRIRVVTGIEAVTDHRTGPTFIVEAKAAVRVDIQDAAQVARAGLENRRATGLVRTRKPVQGDIDPPRYEFNLSAFYLPVTAGLYLKGGGATEYEIDLQTFGPDQYSQILQRPLVLSLAAVLRTDMLPIPYGAVNFRLEKDETIKFYQGANLIETIDALGAKWYPIGSHGSHVDGFFAVEADPAIRVDFEIQLPG